MKVEPSNDFSKLRAFIRVGICWTLSPMHLLWCFHHYRSISEDENEDRGVSCILGPILLPVFDEFDVLRLL